MPSATSIDSTMVEASSSRYHSAGFHTGADDSKYDGWMNNFCDEPSGDAQTCCLGFWLPCLLYGRIEERVNLVQRGQSPHNAAHGCNADCLIWQVSLCGFAGALTANRRTRVRGLYDIKGTLKNDCIKSLFCNMCILMQLDREIRARDGKTSLRTSADYTRKCSKVIRSQPQPTQIMTYGPGEGAQDRQNVKDMVLCRRPSQPCRPVGIKQSETYRLQEIVGASNIDYKAHFSVNDPGNEFSVTAAAGIKDKGKKAEKATSTSNPAQTKGSGSNSQHSTQAKPGVLKSLLGGIFSTIPEEDSAKRDRQTDHEQNQHSIDVCPADIEDPREQTIEHSLTDCDSIIVTGQRPASASVNQSSYAHDFTDCPVDGDMLRFIDKQEHGKRAKASAKPSATGSVTKAKLKAKLISDANQRSLLKPTASEIGSHKSLDSQQHALRDCEGVSAGAPGSSQESAQHMLADCETVNLDAFPVPNAVENSQPSKLSDCCLEDSADRVETPEHKLSDCPESIVVITTKTHQEEQEVVDSERSPPDNKIRPSSYGQRSKSVKTTTPANFPTQIKESSIDESEGLDDCCELGSPVTFAQQHRISQCSRSSSMSALKPQVPGHRLSTCIRSSSMPILDAAKSDQHVLDDCSSVGSDREHLNSSQQSAVTHDLDECDEIGSSESHHNAEISTDTANLKSSTMERNSEHRVTNVQVEELGQDQNGAKRKSEYKSSKTSYISTKRNSANGNDTDGSKAKKRSKAKERADARSKPSATNASEGQQNILEGLPSSTVARHAELESQVEKTDKNKGKSNPDVVIAVDVLVDGQKYKAKVVPIPNDRISTVMKRVGDESAKRSLESIIASSSKDVGLDKKSSRQHPYQRYPRGKKLQPKETSLGEESHLS